MSRNRNRYSESQLRNILRNNVDAFEANNADDAPMNAVGAQASLQATKGNPSFDAQFDLQIITKYFSVAAGAFTLRTAAYMLANAAALATDAALSFFIFGQADFASGFKKIRSRYPLASWSYGSPFIYGSGSYFVTVNNVLTVLDATAIAQLQTGDLVIPYYATNGGVFYVAFVIVRCTNVGYGTLLAATNSDSFVLNRIRYIQNDTSAAGLNQFSNAIGWYKQSLFGKADEDSITPNSQKPPEQFQAGIIDVPIVKAITKEISFGSSLNYDAVSLQWSIFVKTVNKLPINL
jgi:hypothetical protein